MEGPILKNKLSILAGARSTHSDWMLKLAKLPDVKSSSAWFNDLNAKISFRSGKNGTLSAGAHRSEDYFRFAQQFGYRWKTTGANFSWRQTWQDAVITSLTAAAGKLQNTYFQPEGSDAFELENGLEFRTAHLQASLLSVSRHEIQAGAQWNRNNSLPQNLRPRGASSGVLPQKTQQENGEELAFYAGDEFKISEKIGLYAGLRYSYFRVQVRGEFFTSNNADGSVAKEPRAYAYAYATAPGQASGRYLRWEGDVVYIFNELPKIYNPFAVQHQCFVTNRISDQTIALADLSIYQPGASVYEQVGKRKIDVAFENSICFSVYQHTMTRNAWEYWQKISQLTSPTGTIFDKPLARVYGNVENVTDPENPALGYFEVSAVDTARVYTRNGLLGDEFLLQDYPYCNYDWGRWPPVTHPECDDCLLLPSSTLQKPDWWQ